MKDTFEFTLNSPLTEEQLDMISDVDFDRTDSITFHTKHGKEVEFTKVIRCRDCKHQVKEWRTDKRLKDKGYMVCGCDVVGAACGYWALLGQDEDFCSMAEPKESDE